MPVGAWTGVNLSVQANTCTFCRDSALLHDTASCLALPGSLVWMVSGAVICSVLFITRPAAAKCTGLSSGVFVHMSCRAGKGMIEWRAERHGIPHQIAFHAMAFISLILVPHPKAISGTWAVFLL